MRITATTICAALLLSGCVSVSWPPARGGGVAEIAPPDRHTVVLTQAGDTERELLARLESLESELAQHIASGAMQYVPAETTLARLLTARIRREIAGTLYSAASTDLIELGDRLSVIDRILAKNSTLTEAFET